MRQYGETGRRRLRRGRRVRKERLGMFRKKQAPPICSSRNISTTFDAHRVAHNLLIQSVKSATSPLSRVGCVLYRRKRGFCVFGGVEFGVFGVSIFATTAEPETEERVCGRIPHFLHIRMQRWSYWVSRLCSRSRRRRVYSEGP